MAKFEEERSRRAQALPTQIPNAVSTKGGPKISAGAILSRDGSKAEMRRVPDFGQILDNMNKHRKQIVLQERCEFIPAQMPHVRT